MKAYSKMARAGSAAVVFAVACAGSLLACSSEGFQPGSGGGTAGAEQDGGGAAGGAAGMAGSGSGGLAGAETGGSAGAAGAAGAGGAAGAKGTADNGATCAAGSDCKSGYCVDGVCCDSGCDKDCESCAVAGLEGTCTPFDKGTDPESECNGSGKPGDKCVGSCDGASACEFPDVSTACGTPVCTGSQSTGYACDGTGSCKMATVDCAPYNCGGTDCKTSCAKDTDCVSGNFCSAGKCVAKKPNGQTCGGANQCTSGNCVDGTCCNVSSCGSPFSCSDGTCKCGGAVCGAGEACVLWYKDADGDKYGDPDPNKAKYGCASKAPAGYVSNKNDCYDGNINAYPGQTNYFDVDRGDGSFDYDCNNQESHKYGIVSASDCTYCAFAWGYGCNSGGVVGPKVSTGYHGPFEPGCGVGAFLYACTASGSDNATTYTKQPCR